jgi:hypothetical protein
MSQNNMMQEENNITCGQTWSSSTDDGMSSPLNCSTIQEKQTRELNLRTEYTDLQQQHKALVANLEQLEVKIQQSQSNIIHQ